MRRKATCEDGNPSIHELCPDTSVDEVFEDQEPIQSDPMDSELDGFNRMVEEAEAGEHNSHHCGGVEGGCPVCQEEYRRWAEAQK